MGCADWTGVHHVAVHDSTFVFKSEKLNPAFKEAARDLGASPSQTFLKITLPLSSSGIIAGMILVFIPSLGLFFIPDILGGSKSFDPWFANQRSVFDH